MKSPRRGQCKGADKPNTAKTLPENQTICCRACAYHRTVKLEVRSRTFCWLSGERRHPAEPACEHFTLEAVA